MNSPYVPKYSSNPHSGIFKNKKDAISEFTWIKNDIISCSKDGTLKIQNISDFEKPKKEIQKISNSINIYNEVAYIGEIKEKKTVTKSQENEKQGFLYNLFGTQFGKETNQTQCQTSDQKYLNFNKINIVKFENDDLFMYYATNYKLFNTNMSIREKCIYNSKIASNVSNFEVESLWLLLSVLDMECINLEESPNNFTKIKNRNTIVNHRKETKKEEFEFINELEPNNNLIEEEEFMNNMCQFNEDKNALYFDDVIIDLILELADKSEVQTVVCIISVLGEKFKSKFDADLVRNWELSYIDLLSMRKEFDSATEVVKNLGYGNQTPLKIRCLKCKEKCKCKLNQCVICHKESKGLFYYLSCCSSGGHYEHIMNWIKKFHICPNCGVGIK
jgi:hypothetical protein